MKCNVFSFVFVFVFVFVSGMYDVIVQKMHKNDQPREVVWYCCVNIGHIHTYKNLVKILLSTDGCTISLGTSSTFAIMPAPRKHLPLLPYETSSVSALIQACLFLLNKWLYASLCVWLILCYIAGKQIINYKNSILIIINYKKKHIINYKICLWIWETNWCL